jgi:hypothetical protein
MAPDTLERCQHVGRVSLQRVILDALVLDAMDKFCEERVEFEMCRHRCALGTLS